MSEKPLAGRIAVVTGASRGIGYHAAKGFAAAGAHVVAVARTVGGLEELDDEIRAAGGSATLVPLDLQGFRRHRPARRGDLRALEKLDVLLANAGVLGQLSPLGHIPPKVWDEVMAVNVTANWRLIRSLDPLLRQSDAGRAMFMIVGRGAEMPRPFWGPYSVSKAALEALVRNLCQARRRTRRSASSRSIPGRTRTAMRAKAMPGEDPTTLPQPSEIVPHLVEMASPIFQRTNVLFDVSEPDLHGMAATRLERASVPRPDPPAGLRQ